MIDIGGNTSGLTFDGLNFTDVRITYGGPFAGTVIRGNYFYRNGSYGHSSAGAGELTGMPTFVGGKTPRSYAGFELAPGSAGKGAGATPPGSDIGINAIR